MESKWGYILQEDKVSRIYVRTGGDEICERHMHHVVFSYIVILHGQIKRTIVGHTKQALWNHPSRSVLRQSSWTSLRSRASIDRSPPPSASNFRILCQKENVLRWSKQFKPLTGSHRLHAVRMVLLWWLLIKCHLDARGDTLDAYGCNSSSPSIVLAVFGSAFKRTEINLSCDEQR